MATEKKIREVLDLYTTTSIFTLQALDERKQTHTKLVKSIVESKNIVGMGISEKISNDKKTGKLALTFYVEKKIPLDKLKGNQVIPAMLADAGNGNEVIPTDVVVLGKIRPEIFAKRNPLQPGNSMAHPSEGAGTFGAVVSIGAELYALSNSHVLAKNGLAKIGDPILYPGSTDGGTKTKDVVATLFKFVKFDERKQYVNRVDCAIAKIKGENISSLIKDIQAIGLPKGITKAKRGMKVIKAGRTSELTEGEVRDTEFRVKIKYDGVGEIWFTDQVLCSNFTDPGDSGALVLEKSSKKAVGLHFCGSNVSSAFNPINIVLSELGVKLLTKKTSRKTAAKKSSS